MESYQESGAGYPEEAPSEVVPDDEGVREGGRPRREDVERAPRTQEGTATGDPASAGSSEPPAEEDAPGGG